MSRSVFHRPAGSRLLETVAVVALSRRKAMVFNLIEENGVRLGEIVHAALRPDGRPVIPARPQRLVMAEPIAARFIEAAASVGVRLREAK